MKEAVIAFDQSPLHVGRAIFIDGKLESHGEIDPDPPDYDNLRQWVGVTIGLLQRQDECHVTVVVESIYMKFFKGKPQVHTYQTLARTQSHIWAAARMWEADVVEMTPYKAMVALTGITDIKTKTEVRKPAMVAAATRMVGEPVSEHTADAIGLGLAYINTKSAPK